MWKYCGLLVLLYLDEFDTALKSGVVYHVATLEEARPERLLDESTATSDSKRCPRQSHDIGSGCRLPLLSGRATRSEGT